MYDQQFLINLIANKVEESINLDFKASGALQRSDQKTKEISKDVSAFANSAGGVIIYGLKEHPDNRHIAFEIDSIDRGVISKEWLEQIIQGQVQPRIDGVKIHPIEVDNEVNWVVYVVEIPKSNTAHQANDKKYYKRFNFNSEPMHDYEIRDILNRVKNPSIKLRFEVTNYQQHDDYFLKVISINEGTVLANYVNAYLTIPSYCLEEEAEFGEPSQVLFGDNTVRDVIEGYPVIKYGPARYVPVLPRMTRRLSFNDVKLRPDFAKDENSFDWIVYADNAEPVTGTVIFAEIEIDYI